jgi:uncharacterized phage protein (TIGR01671 family)
MNRQLKFRAWDTALKKFHTGEVTEFNTFNFNFDGDYKDTEAWQQFTGLLDKNGKEIYEGDIVKTDYDKGTVIWGGAEVDIKGNGHEEDWVVLHAGWSFNNKPLDCYHVEVIGNIYENPELIK